MKIYIVTPWFGVGSGGAEHAARWIASVLVESGFELSVLTTVLGNPFIDGAPELSPGSGILGGISVVRFKAVRSLDPGLTERIERGEALSEAEESKWIKGNVSSEEMERYIGSHQDGLYIFIPYCFGTTVRGIERAKRSVIVPCLHDEGSARMGVVRRATSKVEGVVFLSEPEKDLFVKLYGEPAKYRVTGIGVLAPPEGDPERFRRKYEIDGPYWLTLGRRNPAKGSFQAALDYGRYYEERGGKVPILVTAGPGRMSDDLKNLPGVRDVGLLGESLKWDALAGSCGLINPSLLESFSFVIMDAWQLEKPVLVNESCAVTRFHVEESNGGLWYSDYETFSATLDYLNKNPEIARTLGKQGREYVAGNFDPESVKSELVEFLSRQ